MQTSAAPNLGTENNPVKGAQNKKIPIGPSIMFDLPPK